MCKEAPVAQQARKDCIAAFGGKVSDDGIIASEQHSADGHRSSHNCADTNGGQELPIDGVGYDPNYAHAWDAAHAIGDDETALAVRVAFLADERVRYVIDRGIGYYPPHRGGGTFPSTGHQDHDHISFMPGTTFDTRPFLFTGDEALTDADKKWLTQEFANITEREKAIVEKSEKDLHDQAQRQGEADRKRDTETARELGELSAAVRDLSAVVSALAKK